MGRVFSWSEVSRNEVPGVSSFMEDCREIERSFRGDDSIYGAVFFGSALNVRFTERSDLDCLVVYDDERYVAARDTLIRLQEFALSRYIPIEFVAVDDATARTGLHTIGPSLLWHLERAVDISGGAIKKDPLIFINHPASLCVSDVGDVLGYLRRKIYRFETGILNLPVMQPEEMRIFLQKVLESAVHIARKVTWLSTPRFPCDSKHEVITHYPVLATHRLRDIFQTLLDMDVLYSDELLRQLRDPNERRYLAVLDDIKRRAFWAREFARANAFFVANKFVAL